MTVQSLGGVGPGVSAVSGTTPTTMTSPPPSPAMNGTLKGISQQLGMSTGNVQSALRQGQSITDLAQQQNVSRSSLVQSAEGQIQRLRQASGQSPIDSTVLDRMVNRAFDHHRPAPATGDGGPGAATAPPTSGSANVPVSGFSTLA